MHQVLGMNDSLRGTEHLYVRYSLSLGETPSDAHYEVLTRARRVLPALSALDVVHIPGSAL